MPRSLISTALLGLLTGLSFGQTVTSSATAPANDIITSSPVGGIDTALFDEDSNPNHSRGQLFTLPEGESYQINSITLRKSNAQTYLNDTLTMLLFEGTADQWTSGTGHDFDIDGSDYLVDTTVTLLHTEAFTLSETYNNNDFVTFEFATPIIITEGTDFGFFMTYDQGEGTENRFRHRENGSGGGRLSITETAHGSTAEGSRRIHFYVGGSIIDTGISNSSIAASEELIVAGNSVDVSVTFDTTADTASLSTPAGPVDLFTIDATDDTPGDGVVVISDSPTDSFLYEITVTKAGEEDESTSVQVLVANPENEAPDNAFSTALKADAPLFYYRFEEDSTAGFLYDSSGNGHHTSDFTDTLTLGDGPGGMQNAALFNQSSILIPAASNMGASFTATMVVNSAVLATAGNQNYISMTDGELIGRSLFYSGNGQLRTFISGAQTNSPGSTVLHDDTSCLFHFVFDTDPDDNPATVEQEVRYYVNGELQGGSFTLPNSVDQNIGNWVIGAHKGRTFNFVQGWMDETAIYATAMTDAQIAAHATAFFAAADPLLGFATDLDSADWGNPVTLTWKISDQATAVTINGIAQTFDGGGLYTTVVNPTADTTYSLEVTGPGGPFIKTVDVTVVGGPPAAPQITSISTDGANPPNITLEITGEPNTTYLIKASTDLNDGFIFEMADDALTDDSGQLSITFPTVSQTRFFRVETP
ncbi:LamG domain-containing protein [Akkermansiaceae bacterium]|nr:LamG domain-containing protein [Akkermansiaceae bacterium]